jgi:hypothetical protein
MIRWEPFEAEKCARLRITETSCCCAFEWVCQGGEFLVLRHTESGYEESGRGRYQDVRRVWTALCRRHVKTDPQATAEI